MVDPRPESWESWDRELDPAVVEADVRARAKLRTNVAHSEAAQRCKALGARLILDMGCGGGDLSGYVRDVVPGARYTGVDISRTMVVAARKIHTGARFRWEDATRLTDEDHTFDVVVLRHVLTYQPLFRGEMLLHEAARLARQAVLVSLYRTHEGAPTVDEGQSGSFYDNSWDTNWLVERMAGWGFPVVADTRLGDQDTILDFRRVASGS